MKITVTDDDGSVRDLDLVALPKSETGVYVLRTRVNARDLHSGEVIMKTLARLAKVIRERSGDQDALVVVLDEYDKLESIPELELRAAGWERERTDHPDEYKTED